MANETNNLECRTYSEQDLARWDYEHPILLRPEYQGLPVIGNFNIQTAEKIFRRVVGIVRAIDNNEFQRFEEMLNYQHENNLNQYEKRALSHLMGYIDWNDKRLWNWIDFKSTKYMPPDPIYKGCREMSGDHIGIRAVHSMHERTRDSSRTSYKISAPVNTLVLGDIPARINEIVYMANCPSISISVWIHKQNQDFGLSTSILLDAPFPNEKLSD